jgi:hypothetical protein
MNLRTRCGARIRLRPPRSHTVRAGRGKSHAVQLTERAREAAPQIVGGSRMAPRKAGASPTQPRCDIRPWWALPQQFLGDSLVGDAPVGLRESLWNPQAVQPSLIGFAGYRGLPGDTVRRRPAPSYPPEEFQARPVPPATVPQWLPAALSLRRHEEAPAPQQSAGGPA